MEVNEEEEEAKKIKRANRFKTVAATPVTSPPVTIQSHNDVNDNSSSMSQSQMHKRLKGSCTNLEKKYFRLTGAPVPSDIRPYAVLVSAFVQATSRNSLGQYDYPGVCDQLKSIRQDLTVQHIANPFTVQVYESHARLALQARDMSEFNICQSKLLDLRKAGRVEFSAETCDEFDCYR